MRKLKKEALEPNKIRESLRELIRQTLQEALEAELEEFLGYSKYERNENDNYRNGYTTKIVKTDIYSFINKCASYSISLSTQ